MNDNLGTQTVDAIDCTMFLMRQQHQEGHPPRAQILPDPSTVLESINGEYLESFSESKHWTHFPSSVAGKEVKETIGLEGKVQATDDLVKDLQSCRGRQRLYCILQKKP